MGKAILTGLIEDKSKEGWEKAAALIPSENREGACSLAELLDRIGKALLKDAEKIEANGAPDCRIIARLAKKTA